MQKAGKITFAIGIVSIVLFVGLEVTCHLLGFLMHSLVISISIPTVALGALLWLAGYIVGGFARESS